MVASSACRFVPTSTATAFRARYPHSVTTNRTGRTTSTGTRRRVGAGLSTHEDGREAARVALEAALGGLGGQPADLVFLFVSPQHEDVQRAIIDIASDRVEGATVLGCSAGGVIGARREIEDAPAVAAWAASLPGIGVQPFRLTFQREGDHAIIEGLEDLPSPDEQPVLIMLADPFSFPADVLLDHLNDSAAGPPIVGGMASGGLEAGRNSLYFNDEILRDGAVGAILTGGGMTAVVSQGCRPVGQTYAVTRAEQNVLFELGGSPAMTRIEELYAESSERDQLLIRRGLHVGSAITETKPELGRGDFLIRNVVGVDRDSGGSPSATSSRSAARCSSRSATPSPRARTCGSCSSGSGRPGPARSRARCCSPATAAVRDSSVSPTTTLARCGARSATFRSLDSSPRASSAPSLGGTSCTGSRRRSC